MSNYRINIQATDGTTQTLWPDIGFNYTRKLNEVNEGKFDFSATTPLLRTLAQLGGFVIVYRNGTIDYVGRIIGNAKLDGGGISVRTQGWEIIMADDSGSYSNSPYSSTASSSIANDIITESPASIGTIDTGLTMDFRIAESTTYQAALENLRKKTAQDLWYDYTAFPNVTANLVDHQGSSTSRYTFNDGMDINNLDYSTSKPKGNKILVYGKGDGENQIRSAYPSHGYDATSQSTYGTILYIERDPTIVSVSEANQLADKIVAAYKNPVKYYWFEINNPNTDIVEGDVITLNSADKDLEDEEVRVTGIQRTISGTTEILSLQVTNKENSELLTKRDKLLGKIQANQSNSDTYMQGTTNVLTFSEMINANNTAPLRVKAYLPEDFIKDEVGNLRVNSFTLDYDVDPYRSGVGTAATDNEYTGAGITNSSSYTNAGMTNTSAKTSNSAATITATSKPFSSSWYSVISNYSAPSFSSAENFAIWRYEIMYVNGTSGTTISNLGVRITDSDVSGSAGYILYTLNNSLVIGNEYPVWTGAIPWNCSGHHFYVDVKGSGGGASLINSRFTIEVFGAHTHSNSYNDSTHTNPNSYNDASHNHNVSIGDSVSDSGSTNASSVNIYLDFWNGSSWVNKHSILNTGKTIDYDVDLSNGGQYPDAPGYWQVRVYSNSASPDLFQGAIKCKHEMDT